MIYIFRKEMKKWQNILWLVFIALSASGLSFMFLKPKDRQRLQVADVNGQAVTFDEFHKALADLQERLNALRPYAAMYGMSEEAFINTFFGGSPEDLAIRTCIREKLIDSVKHSFNIQFDDEWFKNELVKSLPHLADETGHVNMDAYNGYLQRMSVTPAEYEQRKEEEFKRELFNRFIQNAAYVPQFAAKEQYEQSTTLKRFKILEIPQTYFLKLAEQKIVSDKELEAFYVKHPEDYRLPEKRKACYWIISPGDYASKIDLDEQTIQNFYDKNKSSMFRVPPKVNVRHILIKNGSDAVARINDLVTKAKAKPALFAELVRLHSQDEKSLKNGGLTGFFEHGSYDTDFEKAAFRLKTPGEISDVVKTHNGYEIIQLVERIQAAEKPLNSVREEIIKTLRTKKTALAVRSDLERVVRSARDDQQLATQFATGMNLKAVETTWLTDSDTKTETDSVESLLGKKLFGKNKQAGQVGYFPFESKYVLYQLVQVQKSIIQPLNAIKAQVTKDYYQDVAEEKASAILKDLKADLLDKKLTLAQAAQRFGGALHTTGLLKSGAKIEGLEHSGNLNAHIFELVDGAQVLAHMAKAHSYVVQLDGIEHKPAQDDQALAKIIKQEKFRGGSLEMGAFIASLERNAKIEINKKMIDMGRIQ